MGSTAEKVQALEPYVRFDSKHWVLETPEERPAAISEDEIEALREHIDLLNMDIETGPVTMTVKDSDEVLEVALQPDGNVTSKGWHAWVEKTWWGMKLHLDSYLTGKILGLGSLSTASATIIAAAAATGPAAAAIGASIGLLVAAITLCRERDGSVTIYWVFGAWGCNPF